MPNVNEKASSKGFYKMATVAIAHMILEMPCGVKAVDPKFFKRFSAALATAVMKALWTAKAAKLQALFAKSWDLNSSMHLSP